MGIINRKYGLFALFFGLVVFTFLTHYGDRSPYSWTWALYGHNTGELDGHAVNPDSLVLPEFTRFFYQPSVPNFSITPNINLPLPAFTTSLSLGFFRSFMLSNYVINLVAMAILIALFLNFAKQNKISNRSLLISGLTVFSLPYVGHYIGQPLTYITGPVISFCVVFILCGLIERGEKCPWTLGSLLMILGMNYDPYVFITALVIWVVCFYRFPKLLDYVIFFGVGLLPIIVWRWTARQIGGEIGDQHGSFFGPILASWLSFVKHPTKEILFPFLTAHVGLTFVFRQTLSYLFWPLLGFTLFLLWKAQPSIQRSKTAQFIALLAGSYFLEQMATAAFDWENNPRRAIPLLFCFGYAYVYLVEHFYDTKKIRRILIVLVCITFFLSFADFFLNKPVIQALQFGQVTHTDPKQILEWRDKKLTKESLPNIPQDKNLALFQYGQAKVDRAWLPHFVLSQSFLFLNLFLIFFYLARLQLLPKRSPHVFGVVFILSLIVRFL